MMRPRGWDFHGVAFKHSKVLFLHHFQKKNREKKERFVLPPPIKINFLGLSSWFIDAAKLLWSLNHETRRSEQDGDLMTAEGQGHAVYPAGSLPLWDALSDNRSCTALDFSHVLLIACQATQENRDVFARVCLRCRQSDSRGRVHFVFHSMWTK